MKKSFMVIVFAAAVFAAAPQSAISQIGKALVAGGEVRLIPLGLLAGRVVVIAHAPRGEDTYYLHEKGKST